MVGNYTYTCISTQLRGAQWKSCGKISIKKTLIEWAIKERYNEHDYTYIPKNAIMLFYNSYSLFLLYAVCHVTSIYACVCTVG